MIKKIKQHKHSALIRRIILGILGVLLGINIYLANAQNIVGNKLPMPFGMGAAIVLSGSMSPEINVNDLIIVKESNDYQKNDIVVYDGGREMIVHRIIQKNKDSIITKGDANNVADDPISVKAIKGKVVLTIPCLGILIQALRSPIGLVIIILVAVWLIEGSFRRKKEIDSNQIEAIKEEIRKLKDEQNK